MLISSITSLVASGLASAEEVAAVAHVAQTASSNWGPFGAFLALGLAAFGGALGQAKAAAAALDGIARNPSASGKIFVPMVIGLALIESLVLYAFVIAFRQ